MLDEEDEHVSKLFPDSTKRKRNTMPRPGGSNDPSKGRTLYWQTQWGIMLRHPKLKEVGSPQRRQFMRRFRTPYPLYLSLLKWTKGWHEMNSSDSSGRPRCPTDLKLLGYLRICGRAACFDDIHELSGISITTMQKFFHTFSEQGREKLFPIHVKMPSTTEEVAVIETAYASLGLPGAVGSMDVVHIPLGACPAGLSNLMTGKEGYPSIGYNVICDHLGRALALMPGVYGSINDKTIVKFDEAVEDVKTKSIFTDYTYEIRSEQGGKVYEKGVHIIVDGGYLKWEVLQCGLKTSSEPGYSEWRKRMESVRKDIECYFGRLKQRFKVLKNPILFHQKCNIDDMMFTLVAIQNMILDWKVETNEYQSWEVQANWQTINPSALPESNWSELQQALILAESEDREEEEATTDHILWCVPQIRKRKKKKDGNDEFHGIGTDFSSVGRRGISDEAMAALGWIDWGEPNADEKERFTRKQGLLVSHYTWFCNAHPQ